MSERANQRYGVVTVRIDHDPTAAAAAAIGRRLAVALRRGERATLAVSGGSTAPPLFRALAAFDLAWDRVDVWQVDERVAPDGDPDRNANALVDLPGRHQPMPVTAKDVRRAARRYAATLPDRFDVLHLGMGPDGHTASWPPGDPVIDSTAPVDLSQEYQGRIRMTLTPSVVNAARRRVALIPGADKAEPVAAWIERRDPTLPITRVHRTGTVVVLDPPAAARLTRA